MLASRVKCALAFLHSKLLVGSVAFSVAGEIPSRPAQHPLLRARPREPRWAGFTPAVSAWAKPVRLAAERGAGPALAPAPSLSF